MQQHYDQLPSDFCAEEEHSSYAALITNVQAGTGEGLEQLYQLCRKFRYYFARQLRPDDIDDGIHDIFLSATKAIKAGSVQRPESLFSYIYSIARYYVYDKIDDIVNTRRRKIAIQDYEDVHSGKGIADASTIPADVALYRRQVDRIAHSVIRSLHNTKHSEILLRILSGQEQKQICREMEISDTQFRLTKSRAKVAFCKNGGNELRLKPRWFRDATRANKAA